MKAMMQAADHKRKRSDIAWKPDYTLLAVGNEDGLVMLLVKTSSSSGILSSLLFVVFHYV
jgi:hypothetical protein